MNPEKNTNNNKKIGVEALKAKRDKMKDRIKASLLAGATAATLGMAIKPAMAHESSDVITPESKVMLHDNHIKTQDGAELPENPEIDTNYTPVDGPYIDDMQPEQNVLDLEGVELIDTYLDEEK
jgi:hypothetical protein